MRNIILVGIILGLCLAGCENNFTRLQRTDNIYKLSTEEQLKDENYSREIEDFYTQGDEGYFTGQAGIPVYYKLFSQPDPGSPAILISSGRTEAAIKYKEVIFDLYNNGYSVYIHDHRGQGHSEVTRSG